MLSSSWIETEEKVLFDDANAMLLYLYNMDSAAAAAAQCPLMRSRDLLKYILFELTCRANNIPVSK